MLIKRIQELNNEDEEKTGLENFRETIEAFLREIYSDDSLSLVMIKNKDPSRDYCLIVDEIGKLKDGWTERINIRASRFYPGTFQGDSIVGDVVLCAREWTDSFGECDLAGLSDHELEVLISIFD